VGKVTPSGRTHAATLPIVDDAIDIRLLVGMICESDGPDLEVVAGAVDGEQALAERTAEVGIAAVVGKQDTARLPDVVRSLVA
jgi:hypothetical protein